VNITRRTAIGAAAALAMPGHAAKSLLLAPMLADRPAPLQAPSVAAAGKHRYQQAQLFQGAPSQFLADGGAQYAQDISGPNHLFVSTATGWRWTRPGGDWLDLDGVRHGPKPWASAPSIGGARTVDGKVVHDERMVSLDVTAAVNKCHAADRWMALLLTATGASRRFAGRTHPTRPAPVISVVYADGTAGALACLVASDAAASTANSPGATSTPVVGCPAFVEFERPAGPVRSASLQVLVVEHWSGANPALQVWVLDPPTAAAEPVLQGLAQAYPLDAGIASAPGVIGAHTYRDGEPAPILPGPINIHDDGPFSPHLWREGLRDTGRLPDRGLGQWINLPEGAAIVPSTHKAPGFTPLAPGLGALQLHMPGRNIKRGDIVGSSGDTAATAAIYLPDEHFGTLKRAFLRFYALIAPFTVTPESRVLVQHSPGSWQWTTLAGKCLIGPSHDTSWGGVSGSSGGPYGWQMRGSCYMNHSPGPDNRGLVLGHHLFDYSDRRVVPVGHDYGNELAWAERWGRNGLGVIYPGHWYCIETELDLNTILTAAPGWQPDGALRTWIDGKLAFERTGMVFRVGPVFKTAAATGRQRPVRELGIRNLWLNWFHGGKTLNTVTQTQWFAGLVWGTQYIGPMKLQAA